MTASPHKKPPSMQDVARHAGVSAQTVSRVMSNHPYVTDEKRQKVQDAIQALGYRMNATASALSSGRTHVIGVVSVASGSYASAITLFAIECAAEEQRYSVVSAYVSEPSSASICDALLRLEGQGVEAVILAAPLPTADAKVEQFAQRIPVVTIGGSSVAYANSLDIDQEEVARIATSYLLGLGHATVWHVSGPDQWADAVARVSGWRRELARTGCVIPEVIHGDWTPESGFQAGLTLGSDPTVTAVFVGNDEMAFGLIQGLKARGRMVPQEVSVVSVDDIPLAAYCSPSLTTVAQPFAELGGRAVEVLMKRLDAVPVQESPRALLPQLVVRDSALERRN